MKLLMFLQSWDAETMKYMQDKADWGWTANLLLPTIIFIVLVAAIAIIMSVMNMFKNPGALKMALIGVGVLGGIFLLSYLLSSDQVYSELDKLGTSPGTFKLVGAGLLMTGILFMIGLVMLAYDLVKGLFKT